MTTRTERVFLSYSHADAAIAELVFRRLTESSVEVFMDRSSLSAGHEWARQLVSAVRATDVVLCLITRDSASSAAVAREIRQADREDKRIVGLALEAIDYELPGVLCRRQRIQGLGFAQAMDQFLTQIGGGHILRAVSAVGRSVVADRVLVLEEVEDTQVDPTPESITTRVLEIGRVLAPHVRRGAAVALPGYAPLAAALVAHLSGAVGGAPKVLWPVRVGESWMLSPESALDLDVLRTAGRKWA